MDDFNVAARETNRLIDIVEAVENGERVMADRKFFTLTDWVKTRRVVGYYVMFKDETGEHVFSHFAVNRTQSAKVAWHLANALRDDMNAGIR